MIQLSDIVGALVVLYVVCVGWLTIESIRMINAKPREWIDQCDCCGVQMDRDGVPVGPEQC